MDIDSLVTAVLRIRPNHPRVIYHMHSPTAVDEATVLIGQVILDACIGKRVMLSG